MGPFCTWEFKSLIRVLQQVIAWHNILGSKGAEYMEPDSPVDQAEIFYREPGYPHKLYKDLARDYK